MAERELDHDRKVALEQLPSKLRPAFSALWKLDLAFADVVATSSDERLGQIRLAWWRERLEDLDQGGVAPAEPRLQEVAARLIPGGFSGAELSELEEGWLPLLEPFPWTDRQALGLKRRGHVLFGVAARLLGGAGAAIADQAGELWSLVDGAQHCSDEASREFLLQQARSIEIAGRAPRRLRPLTIIAALAAADLRGDPSRFRHGLAAAIHRFTGQFPSLVTA